MSPSRTPARRGTANAVFWDLLTFDRLLTGPVIHLIYWCGLGVIVLAGFFSIGAFVGVALRDGRLVGILLAVPTLVAGLLVCAAMVLLWRGACEFYVVIFRISEDLRAFRESNLPPEQPQQPGRHL
jgi:hypothetical protein